LQAAREALQNNNWPKAKESFEIKVVNAMENLNFARTPQFLRKVINEARR